MIDKFLPWNAFVWIYFKQLSHKAENVFWSWTGSCLDSDVMGSGFLDDSDSPFLIRKTVVDHVIKEDANGPNLAFNVDHFRTDFEFRGNQIFVTVAFVQIECGIKPMADFAHGWKITDFERTIFVDDKLRIELSQNNVSFMKFRQCANEILDYCKRFFNRKRASPEQDFGQGFFIIIFSNSHNTIRISIQFCAFDEKNAADIIDECDWSFVLNLNFFHEFSVLFLPVEQ